VAVFTAFSVLSFEPYEASAAPSAKDRVEAKALVAKAAALARGRHYEDAAAALARAEELDPAPATELELGRALAKAGHLVGATRALHLVIDAKSAAARRLAATAKKELAAVERTLAHLELTVTPASATITIDGEPAHAGTIPLDPGEHRVVIAAPGMKSAELHLTFAAGEAQRAEAQLSPDVPAPVIYAPNASDDGGGTRAPGIVLLAAGGTALIVGGVFGAVALAETSKLKRSCVDDLCSASVADDIAASKRDGTIATATLIGGGVAVVGGVVLFVVLGGKGAKKSDAAARVAPYFTGSGAGLRGRF
jgi:hypothetical protein